MPVDYYIDKAWRHLLDQEVQDLLKRLSQGALLEPTFSQLADFRDVTKISVSSRTIRESVQSSQFGLGAKRAAVVWSAVTYGLSRMYILLRGGPEEMQVFQEVEEALDRLEIESGFPDTLFAD